MGRDSRAETKNRGGSRSREFEQNYCRSRDKCAIHQPIYFLRYSYSIARSDKQVCYVLSIISVSRAFDLWT